MGAAFEELAICTKLLQWELHFLLDKSEKVWYNIITERERKIPNTRKELIMTQQEYRKWIESRLDSFAQILPYKERPWITASRRMKMNYKNYYTCYIGNFFISGDLITRETTIFNAKTKRHTTAKCKVGENFLINDGVAIAWAKYNNELIPDYEDTINRDELMNGDKFISSMNKNVVYTFIGWMPNMRKGLVGKWAVVLDDKNKPYKVQIAETVIKK